MSAGLYVHVPFCQTKCGYCDFYTVPIAGHNPSSLAQALIAELDSVEAKLSEDFETIFMGGGTPTILPLDDLHRLMHRLDAFTNQHEIIEFTVEANPATVTPEVASLLSKNRVDRVSLGAQSFDQRDLTILERLHGVDDIAPSLQALRQCGITNINLDLIFGIPGQSMNSWVQTLQQTLDLGVNHVSCYGLMYEPNTPLTRRLLAGDISRCDEDLEADMYEHAVSFLATHGYQQYEISNFSQPGYQCKHNLIYWSNSPYLGIGPSATSYLGGIRYKNVAHIDTYVERVARNESPVREQEKLNVTDLANETVMLQLRMNEGLDTRDFEQRTGLCATAFLGPALSEFERSGHLQRLGNRIQLTNRGRLLADHVIRSLMNVS